MELEVILHNVGKIKEVHFKTFKEFFLYYNISIRLELLLLTSVPF